MKHQVIFILNLISILSFSQNKSNISGELYSDYREDQFYASVTYNLLNDRSGDVAQSGFSSGFHIGFIRDMPVNQDRDFAFGLGLGLSSNSYNQNLFIEEIDNGYQYSIINENEVNVSKNKFTTYLVEVPFEIRWRTSTATDYNFWRIYAGIKFGYLLYNSTKFKSDNGNLNLSNINDFNEFQYGLTLSIGYGTWNFYGYYGLNSIFKDSAKLNNESIDLKSVKLGLMFYIL